MQLPVNGPACIFPNFPLTASHEGHTCNLWHTMVTLLHCAQTNRYLYTPADNASPGIHCNLCCAMKFTPFNIHIIQKNLLLLGLKLAVEPVRPHFLCPCKRPLCMRALVALGMLHQLVQLQDAVAAGAAHPCPAHPLRPGSTWACILAIAAVPSRTTGSASLSWTSPWWRR